VASADAGPETWSGSVLPVGVGDGRRRGCGATVGFVLECVAGETMLVVVGDEVTGTSATDESFCFLGDAFGSLVLRWRLAGGMAAATP
jgi:hypothetical protein